MFKQVEKSKIYDTQPCLLQKLSFKKKTLPNNWVIFMFHVKVLVIKNYKVTDFCYMRSQFK